MFSKRRINYKRNKGFTLIEIMLVIAIIAIISVVVIPTYSSYIKNSKVIVCNSNCLQFERMYEAHLEIDNVGHSELVFEQFLQVYGKNICHEHGEFKYVDGMVICSVHVSENHSENNDNGEVPFL